MKSGNRYNKTLHRLVAEVFIPNPKNLPQVNHLHTKDKNDVESLEWCTAIDNNCHKIDKSKTSSKYVGVGFKKGKGNKPWYSRIGQKYIGYFDTEKEAHEARLKFEKDNNILNKYPNGGLKP